MRLGVFDRPSFKTSYRQEIALLRGPGHIAWLIALFVGLLVLPLVAGKYWLYLVNQSLIATIGAVSLNLLTGYTGQVSIGHAAFLGIGSFTAAFVATKLGLGFWLGTLAGGLAAAAIGFLVGLPALRLRGLYLLLATFALHYIVIIVLRAHQLAVYGPMGAPLNPPVLGPIEFDDDFKWYFLILPFTIAAVLYAKNLLRSREGRTLLAIHHQETAASVIGVNLARSKVLVFVVSSFMAGVGGSLYGHYVSHITQDSFHLGIAIDYITMIIVGGFGSILGSIVGAAFITMLPQIINQIVDFFDLGRDVAKFIFQIKSGIYGVIIILFLILYPEGIAGFWRKLKQFYLNWPY